MYLTKTNHLQSVVLSQPLLNHEMISYQIELINKSEQSSYASIEVNHDVLYYDITSKLPFEVYFRRACETYESVRMMFLKMLEPILNCETFLLNHDQLIYKIDYIYYDADCDKVMMLYQPFKVLSKPHLEMKKNFLFLLYELVNIRELLKKAKMRKLIEVLQDQEFDLYSFNTFLELNEKDKSFNMGLFKQKKCKKKRLPFTEDVDETVLMKEVEANLHFSDKLVKIEKTPFSIGRSIQLNDYSFPKALSLGRVHAEITSFEGQFFLRDLDSKNGTYLNGVKLKQDEKKLLNYGDLILLANEKVVFK